MALSEHYPQDHETDARILTFDIETQRAIVEVWDLFPKFIHIDRVRVPKRILCFSARWRGEDRTIFRAAWDEDKDFQVEPQAYEKMCRALWELLNQADVVVTWNGDRFDIQWVEEECARLGMGRPRSYKSVDLIKILKRRFKAGLMSMKLDWSARQWLHDQKTPHGATDLWHDIRYGTRTEKRDAQRLMRTYCEHDTALTERLLGEYLPWVGVNFALYRDNSEELRYCTKCGTAGQLKRDGMHHTNAFSYQQYRCKKCGGLSRGKRAKATTELRTIG